MFQFPFTHNAVLAADQFITVQYKAVVQNWMLRFLQKKSCLKTLQNIKTNFNNKKK